MSNANDEVDVAHHLAEDARWHLCQRHAFVFSAPLKDDGINRQSLNLQRRSRAVAERQIGTNTDLWKGLPDVALGDPAPLGQECHRLVFVDLVAGITS